MPLSRSRDYLSIGEVLDNVRPDFPEVSISKIRFLEAEGLISPERTPSGYRKFYEQDVTRLRYILSLQRDQYLPLKVIRERLAHADSDGGVYPTGASPQKAPSRSPKPAVEKAPDLTGITLSRADLKKAAGLDDRQLAGLEDFGILPARADVELYDENDLMIAKAALRFFSYGVEPRHLRMYRQFAEREAAFFGQIVSPVARKKTSDGTKEARRSVGELADASRQMREAALRASLRDVV